MIRKSLLCALLLGSASSLLAAPNEKPFIIPELREWMGQEGSFAFTPKSAIVISKEDSNALKKTVTTFAADLKSMFNISLPIRIGTPVKGDIVLRLGKTGSNNKESYTLAIGKHVTIASPSSIGAFWATRSLLQMLEQSPKHTLPCGEILDYPQYPVRGFLLDVARKFFTLDYLRDYLKFMSYYKMNTFHIHLNDNGFAKMHDNDWNKTYSAFRLESTTYPELTAKDGSYTKKEFSQLQEHAEDLGIEIIPEIDIPAHSLAFSHYLPEIGSKEYGMDHLDLFNPKTYTFAEGLFDEYITGANPVFRGPRVHIGTDEYSNRKKDVVEKFRYFTDHFIKHVKKSGKEPIIWGALTHAKGDTPVTAEDVTVYMWHNPYGQPKDMLAEGFKKMVSIPDGLLYIVPAAGYYYDYLNTQHLYNSWEPRIVGDVTFDAGDPVITGGMFAVWNDHVGNGISQLDVHHRVFPAMQTLATKMWTAEKTSVPFEQFEAKRKLLGEGPGVNLLGRPLGKTGIILEKSKLTSGNTTGMLHIGYDYIVEFDLLAKNIKKGQVLFSSPHATFYLADPQEGKLGFERDGYLSQFDYVVPANKTVHITIKGTNKSTQLLINGKLVTSLDIERIPYGKDKKESIARVQTLVFPLEKVGKFQGTISKLKVSYLGSEK